MAWKVGILTVSDKGSQGKRTDESGEVLKKLTSDFGGEVISYEVIADDQNLIEQRLIHFCDEVHCDLIFTTGGTGFAERDVTPEATKAVIHKEAPGLAEHMRNATLENTRFSILSRAVTGIRGKTLIVNLPGSPKGVQECFESIQDMLPHGLKILVGDTTHHD